VPAEWSTVVEAMPPEEAKLALQCWLESESENGRLHDVKQLRKDTICSQDRTTLVRYLLGRTLPRQSDDCAK
jgi:hypothetical protein